MDKFILKRIKDKIEINQNDYADSFIAVEYNSELDTPEAKKQVEAGKLSMETIGKRIEFLKKLAKKYSK